jgi:predicted permease
MFSELRYAFRSLLRSPGFAAIAVLTLALGIGANTAMFTVFNGVLLKALPYPEGRRLVAVQEVYPKMARFGPALPVTAWHFREWRKQNRSFEDLALVSGIGFTLTVNGEPRRVVAGRVSASLFPILGIRAALGRTFTEDEDRPGADRVVVLSDALWLRSFQRDPGIVGRKILLDGVPFQVVGVLPPVRVPIQAHLNTMSFGDAPAELWKPFAITDNDLAILAEFNYGCLARLKRGVSIAQATADLNVIQNQIVSAQPEKVDLRVTIAELQEQMTGSSRSSLTLLLAAAGAVLLIVVVNLANLLLARAGGRRRELAIRAAIGAPLTRLVRQLLTESILLAVIGGALGALVAKWALAAIVLKAPLDVPGLKDIRMDVAALAFAVVISIASGILFGVLPAWRLARTDPQEALKSGGRAITEGRKSGNLRRLLIAAEVALSAICLVVGGLLLSSFVHLLRVDKGFEADRAMVVGLSLPVANYSSTALRVQFVRSLVDRVEALPGVVAAGVSNRGPLSGEGSNLGIDVEGANTSHFDRPIVDYRCVTPDFFRAIGIPLVSGRVIAESDRDRPVAVVSSLTARRLWPNENPIGKRFRLGADFYIEVVGVVGDVRSSLQKNPNMTVYVPFWQRDRSGFALHVRTSGDPLSIAHAVRAEIRRLDSGLVVGQFLTLDSIVDASVAQRRFQLLLVMVFACAALLLAAIGVYGVVSQSVTQRTNEIGIRLALGATRHDVWRLVARHGLTPVLGGLCAGLAGAAVATRLVSGFLFGVKAIDPLTFAAVSLVLLAAAATACAFPALRATRVDPLIALRYE